MKKVTIKQNALPTLTDKRKAELKVLASMPEREINFSDIPPMDEVTWQNAHRGNFYRPIKQHASVRIDADVLAWLRGSGKGYQTRLNAILRAAMLKDLNNKR